MNKLLPLGLALAAVTLFGTVGLTQQRVEPQGVAYPTRPAASNLKTQTAPTVFQSTSAQVNWPATLGRKQTDLVKALQGEKLTAEVVGSGPQAIIVVYGSDGGCRVCIGSAAACKEACSSAVKKDTSSVN